jgi:MarR family transcriptional regulator, transcriptional regulator for hemolysin
MIDRLQDAGLVERRPDPTDRRAWRLHLTDAARPLLEELRADSAQIVEEALAGVDDNLRGAMSDGLIALRNNLSRKSGEAKTGAHPCDSRSGSARPVA